MTNQPHRPDPDELLRRVVAEEARAKHGKLTLFFGAAPGVGKTYAMLEAARAELERERRDVVVGIVETHGRYETAALVLGLPLLPLRKVVYRGVEVQEFDLDGALARRPDLILIDELAHTNAEGSRHPKRWQDVEELLDAGIDVFSTLNVQHVESLNDVIAKITGVVVRETVPDAILGAAHEIKLVDLPADDLLERLRDGKVYVPAQAQRAIENFFRKGNLIALRELALRTTAERVDAQMREYRKAQHIEQTWATTESILVAVSASPYSAHLLRAARRMASTLHASWFAVYVEPNAIRPLPASAAARLSQNLRLAQQLGAQVATLTGENTANALIEFARSRNITKIIVGKPVALRLRDRFRPSLVDQIVKKSGDIDVFVTAGDPDPAEAVIDKPQPVPLNIPSFLSALGVTALSTALAWVIFGPAQLADVVMTYLLGIVLVASRFGLGPSVSAALLSVAALDFFFVPPYFTFAVGDLRHIVTFAVMFVVAVVISGLTERVRNQALSARQREHRTTALYDLSRELAAAEDGGTVIQVAAEQIERAFGSTVNVFVKDRGGSLLCARASTNNPPQDRDVSVGEWVWANKKEAGVGTNTLPSGSTLYVPLLASRGIVGVLGVTAEQKDRFLAIDQRRHLDAFAAQMALAMERSLLAAETSQARQEIETEQLRSSLLSSVSHDLRTPLAVITGAASTLLQDVPSLEAPVRRELTETILEEAERLNRLIRNLLDMTRLESGAIRVKKEWVPLEEVLGSALQRLEARLKARELKVELPPGLPLMPCDPILIEQALINLLENAAKYSEGGIDIVATLVPGEVVVEVADRGPGIPEGQEARIFEKFHRAVREGSPSGVGLGLAICRAIVTAHGGRIWAENRAGGGASFRFALPLLGQAPMLPPPEPLEPHAEESA
ncbi:MAG: sensor histidine kinase KdpD [Polyangiaceae bacterium]|nr:sensor histidine kinase KdpD [Polyangiaceae bacterium]